MRRKKTLYSNLSNIGEGGAARVKLNNRLFSDKNFLEFANCIINSFFYSGKKYKFNALLRSCSISLKRVVGLNFIQCLYLVYFRLLPFIAIRAKQASNYNASANKSSFTYKSQSIRLRQVFLLS